MPCPQKPHTRALRPAPARFSPTPHAGEAYRMDGHQRTHQVAYQTARTDLLGLEAMGLLHRVKRGNAYVFYAPEDLRERIERLGR